MTTRNLDHLLRPRSVALIDTSTDTSGQPGLPGSLLVDKLAGGGFRGPIWAVAPQPFGRDGVEDYPAIAALPAAPDIAVIASPPEDVPLVVAELAALGTPLAVVVTPLAAAWQRAMVEQAQPKGMRLLGPNCLGVLMPAVGLNASLAHLDAPFGRLALISQSGALITSMLDSAAARTAGFSGIVSLGDMADIDFGDLIDLFAGDPMSSAILLYVESISDPAKFISAARAAARTKPVIAIKAGRDGNGRNAAMASSYDVYKAVFRRAGVVMVETLTELFDAATTLGIARRLSGDRLAIITNSGGAGRLAADAADKCGQIARLALETRRRLDALLPPTWSHGNPVDLIGVVGDPGPALYANAVDAVLGDSGVDAVLVMNCPSAFGTSRAVAEAVAERVAAQEGNGKPVIACWLGDGNADAARDAFTAARVPVFGSPDGAIRGYNYMIAAARAREALFRAPAQHHEVAVAPDLARDAIRRAWGHGQLWLDEQASKDLITTYGISVVPTRFAASFESIPVLCRDLPGPYVVKIVSPQIRNKSDVGGVVLGLADTDALVVAARAMRARVRAARPDADISGFTVQTMIQWRGAYELMVGILDDPTFGPMLMVGAGGKAAQLIDDKALGLPPLDLDLAQAMVRDMRIARLLSGYRDEPAADMAALARVLLALSQMAIDLPEIRELDISPLLVGPQGVIALDARARVSHEATSRLVIRPVPVEWERDLTTNRGRNFHVRPVRPDDEERVADFFAALDPHDRMLRFLSPIARLDRERLVTMTQIDYRRSMNFLALDQDTGAVIGTAELFVAPDFEHAEVAITVRSDLKGQGIGRELMKHLLEYGTAEGIGCVEGAVDESNRPMIEFARRTGATVSRDPGFGGLVIVRRPLRPGGCAPVGR